MEIFSRGGFYFGHEDEDFNAISIHIRNYSLEWEGNAKTNGTIQKDDGSRDGKATKSDGAV